VVENLLDAFCVIDEAHRAIADCMTEAAVGYNLTTLEFRMLHVLANGVAVTPTQCSLSLNMTLSKISKAIGSLEDKACIIRLCDLPDRRLITLEPSDLGLETFELAQGKLYGLWERGLADLGPRLERMAEILRMRL
jgi:DNA-binding MarR family transcriptional regulator